MHGLFGQEIQQKLWVHAGCQRQQAKIDTFVQWSSSNNAIHQSQQARSKDPIALKSYFFMGPRPIIGQALIAGWFYNQEGLL